MKITLSTSGGLAAGLRLGSRPTVVDAAALPQADAEELNKLVTAARREPSPPASGRVPDEMSYTVTVDEGGEPEVLRRSDTTMSQAFADLLGFVQERGEVPSS